MFRCSAFKSACAFSLCLISQQISAGSVNVSYFVAANGMACYEATNETALRLTLQAYANSPWRAIYEGSLVMQGNCSDTPYDIPTLNPEECTVSNVSLSVYLDRDNVNNARWAESESLVAKEFAERQGLEVRTVLNMLEQICKKPVLHDPSASFTHDVRATKGSSLHPFHWTIAKTALPDPRGTASDLDEELPTLSQADAAKIAKDLRDAADKAAKDAAEAQQAAAAAWKAAEPYIPQTKHLEPARPHKEDQSGVESGLISSEQLPRADTSTSGKTADDIAQEVDRLEKELREVRDLLKSHAAETSALKDGAMAANSLRGSTRLPRN